MAFRIVIGGREINSWRFETVRLWEFDARAALASAAPGLLALVPLMRGGDEPATLVAADREIERLAPGSGEGDAAAILLLLAGQRYTTEELACLLGRRRMIQSSVWQSALAEGREEGALLTLRELCREQVRRHHPDLIGRATPVIDGCSELETLKSWVLDASERDAAAFARLLGLR